MFVLFILLFISFSLQGMQQTTDQADPFFLDMELWNAADWRNLEKAKDYISRGADINFAYMDTTPLALACHNARSYEIAHLLLQQPHIDVGADKFRYDRRTPLHLIFMRNSNCVASFPSDQKVTLIKLLLHHDADVNAQDICGDTPLQCALAWDSKMRETQCPYASLPEIQELITAGTRMSTNAKKQSPLDIAYYYTRSPQILCSVLQSPHITKEILEYILRASLYTVHSRLVKFIRRTRPLMQHLALQETEAFNNLCNKMKQEHLPLKILNAYSQELADITWHFYDESHTTIDRMPWLKELKRLENAKKKLKNFQELHVVVCRYYKTRWLLERAQKPFLLPKELIKIIAYYSAIPPIQVSLSSLLDTAHEIQ